MGERMPVRRRIGVMISSRNMDLIPFADGQAALSEVRKQLKAEIETERLFGENLFEVWINEDPPAAPDAYNNWWDECISQVRSADIVLIFYNGRSGSVKGSGSVGICHAEFKEALDLAPKKTRIIAVNPPKEPTGSDADRSFQRYVVEQGRFWAQVATGEELIRESKKALRDAVARMVELGTREARKGRYNRGQALDWSKLDLRARMAAMEAAAANALAAVRGARQVEHGVTLPMSGSPVLVAVHAIPGSPSLAAARELIGRPHLRDHTWWTYLGSDVGGPVHVVACQKNVTESQAMSILGFPDATFVPTDFGVNVADEVQKAQLLFVKDCRDVEATSIGVQRLLDWLGETGESDTVAQRAAARRAIVEAVVAAQEPATAPGKQIKHRKAGRPKDARHVG